MAEQAPTDGVVMGGRESNTIVGDRPLRFGDVRDLQLHIQRHGPIPDGVAVWVNGQIIREG